MDTFVRLKMAMQLSSALQKHERAINASSDTERSSFDKLHGREKLLVSQYRTSTWCCHIKEAFQKRKLPNILVIRFANIFCQNCADEIANTSEENTNKLRKKLIAMRSDMLRQFVELYCKMNIDVNQNIVYDRKPEN